MIGSIFMRRKDKIRKNKGFTIIELLVVVAVIAVLSGIILGILNSTGIQAKGRDSQRKADLGKIQTALEIYFADHREYPHIAGNGWEQIDVDANGDSDSFVGDALEAGYISKIPVDPSGDLSGNPGPCQGDTRRYNYRSDGTYYISTAIMEVETSNDESTCDSLNNWGTNCSTYTNGDVCYGVENP